MNTLIITIYSIIFIIILHLLIKHMLLREKIYKKVNILNNVSEINNDFPKINIEENFSDTKNCNLNIVKNELDDNMEKQLTDYLTQNEDIYKQKTDIYSEPQQKEQVQGANKYNDLSSSNFDSENLGLDKYYEKVVDIHKEINIPSQSFPKEKELKDPKINLNTKIPDNQSQKDSDILWEYKDENIMNGGEINGGLYGWDSTTNSQYASLDDNNTILPNTQN